GITIILGLGEGIEDLPALFELIRKLSLDRITFYSLNPQDGTSYEDQPPPSSIYQSGVIALTRLNFPEIEIIGGTWIDQLPNIGLMLLAGANGITKYPLFSMFGNRYGKKVEEEVKFANRKLLGTFSDLDVLRGIKKLGKERMPNYVCKKKKPKITDEAAEKISEMKKEIDAAVEEYVSTAERRLR
ncbi:MAG: radical SAM protein, partial [Euryarchaeota archaeon]|nr:radical SAM protein [Euryarchaeota archaeon]